MTFVFSGPRRSLYNRYLKLGSMWFAVKASLVENFCTDPSHIPQNAPTTAPQVLVSTTPVVAVRPSVECRVVRKSGSATFDVTKAPDHLPSLGSCSSAIR